MKLLNLKKNINPKLILEKNIFKLEDFVDPPAKYTPGEWFLVKAKDHKSKEIFLLGNANPYTSKGLVLKIVGNVKDNTHSKKDLAWEYIKENIENLYKTKADYKFFSEGGRIVHGNADGIHGLVADLYMNCILVQVSCAGIEQYRDNIKSLLKNLSGRPVYFIDNSETRKTEGLPINDETIQIESLKISENSFEYEILISKMQKTGYYYDHRQNRTKLEQVIRSLNFKINFGLDLFCYVGSWSLHALRSGVRSMCCVDQGDFEKVIKTNYTNNNLTGDISFERSDVFSFLDKCISTEKKFDLVVCDPPGFSKTQSQKKDAVVGYRKLYNKIFKILTNNSILVVASCTQQVSLHELDSLVNEISSEHGRKINILEVGLQSPDHTFTQIDSKSSYIKCLIYKVS